MASKKKLRKRLTALEIDTNMRDYAYDQLHREFVHAVEQNGALRIERDIARQELAELRAVIEEPSFTREEKPIVTPVGFGWYQPPATCEAGPDAPTLIRNSTVREAMQQAADALDKPTVLEKVAADVAAGKTFNDRVTVARDRLTPAASEWIAGVEAVHNHDIDPSCREIQQEMGAIHGECMGAEVEQAMREAFETPIDRDIIDPKAEAA